MTIADLEKLTTQLRHMDILEDRLLDSLERLKTMRTELQVILTEVIKENK